MFLPFSQISIQTNITRDNLRDVDDHLTLGEYALEHSLLFMEPDIALLASPTARLNGTCINGCATLLYSSFMTTTPHTTSQCAILSTCDLVWIRKGLPDDGLWQSLSCTSYWLKDFWVIPIHREAVEGGHWVLCVAYVRTRTLFMFDSIAEQAGWMSDIAVRT